MRSRPSQTAFDDGERAGVIDAARHLQLRRLLAVGRLVAPEAIGAEAPGDRRQLGLAEVVGQVIAAGRQHAGQMADGQLRLVHRIAGALLAEPQHGAGERALGARQQQVLARAALEALRLHPRLLRPVSGASRSQPALRASQTGIDFLLASAASSTAAGPAACFVLSLAAMDEFVKRGFVALSGARGGLTIAVAADGVWAKA